jgi:hypothetical protein
MMNRKVVAGAAALVAWAALTTAPPGAATGASTGLTGTCSASPQLPCSASAGQTYGSLTLDASGNDSEAAVEAAIGHVVGPAADVSPLARGLTTSADEFTFTPSDITRGHSFDWSYSGDAANLAYITVKAANGFAVVGVAGTTEGTIDVSELLGGHDVSHLSVWSTNVSQAEPVAATKLHGKNWLGNMRLSKIEAGKVLCVHVETAEPAECTFTRKSGAWLESKKGWFAKAGQAITLDGKPGGEYVTAAKVGTEGAVPCLEPTGRDNAGTAGGEELTDGCVVETLGSASNATGLPLRNYATLEVCTSSYPHPDGAPLWGYYWSGKTYVFCYQYTGAALNDPNGTERDGYGNYYTVAEYCHVTWDPGYEIPVAKRPATKPYPYPGTVDPESPLLWRPVSNLAIAN